MIHFITLSKPKTLCISSSGSNDNTGTVSDPVLPSYLNSYTFKGNERILFKRDDTIDISQTVTVDQPGVYFGAYGTGANPVLRGSTAVTGFSDEGGGIYSKVLAEPDWLFLNGSEMKLAETDWIEALTSPASNQLTITHSDVSGYSSIVGSKVVYKARRWKVDPFNVQAYNGSGTITLDSNLVQVFQADKGLKLLGKTDYFSANDEWAYESGTLYVKSASSPTGVRENAYNDMFVIQADNCRFENIAITEVYRNGIKRESGNNLYISNCSIHDIRGNGVFTYGFEELFTVLNCSVYNCSYNGVVDHSTLTPVITSNTIYNIGKSSNYGWKIDSENSGSGSCGIRLQCDNNQITEFANGGTVQYNTVYNIGYNGIAVRGKNNSIKYNYIHDCLERFGDGGGIYSFGGNTNATVIDFEGNTVQYNIVVDCLGSEDGIYATPPDEDVKGIYLDNESILNTVSYNVVDNCNVGILTNRGTYGNTITDNIVVKCEIAQMWYTNGRAADTYPVNHQNTLNDNVLACGLSTAYCLYAELQDADPDYNPYDNGGSADNNYYIQPYASNIAYDENDGDNTLAGLKTLYGQDANSTSETNTVTPPGTPATDLILYTNPTNATVSQAIPAGYHDVDGNDIGGTTQEIPPFYGLLIIKDV